MSVSGGASRFHFVIDDEIAWPYLCNLVKLVFTTNEEYHRRLLITDVSALSLATCARATPRAPFHRRHAARGEQAHWFHRHARRRGAQYATEADPKSTDAFEAGGWRLNIFGA